MLALTSILGASLLASGSACNSLIDFEDRYRQAAADASLVDASPLVDTGTEASPLEDVSIPEIVAPVRRKGLSCEGLEKTCGANADQDCCSSGSVPGGAFNRLNDARYPATISAFRLNIYEVTVGRFRKFVDSGFALRTKAPQVNEGHHPKNLETGWQGDWNVHIPETRDILVDYLWVSNGTWTTNVDPVNEARPIKNVNWYQAFAFCVWDGGRLPTFAEWNFAASGGDEQRKYPWAGQEVDASYANIDCLGDGKPDTCAVEEILRVGSRPKGNARWGHSDMVGNVWEWVFDAADAMPETCSDCAELGGSSAITVSGGYETRNFAVFSNTYQGNHRRASSNETGFRCAYDE